MGNVFLFLVPFADKWIKITGRECSEERVFVLNKSRGGTWFPESTSAEINIIV